MRRFSVSMSAVLVGAALVLLVDQGRTQAPTNAKVDCNVAECAQMMVEISNKLAAEADRIKTRLTSLQADLENVKSQSIPAMKTEFQTKINELATVKPS